MDFLIGAAGLILSLSCLFFIHELGHYLLAKWNGVRVNVFSLGIGPSLASFTWGETKYVWSWVPIGGYVKVAGLGDKRPALETSQDPRDYRNKKPGQRAAISAAGAIFNLLFALFAFAICYYVGVEVQAPRVGDVDPDSPIAHAEVLRGNDYQESPLQKGDYITKINGEYVKSFTDVALLVACSGKENELWIDYERNGLPMHDPVRVTTTHQGFQGAAAIGINPYIEDRDYPLGFAADRFKATLEETRVVVANKPMEGSPAAKADIREGDLVISLDGVLIHQGQQLVELVKAAAGKEQTLIVQRKGWWSGVQQLEVHLAAAWMEEAKAFRMGLPMSDAFPVTDIDPNCEAYAGGLRKGYFVKELRILRSGKEVELTFSELPGNAAAIQTLRVPSPTKSNSILVYTSMAPSTEEVKYGTFVEALSVAWGDLIFYSSSVLTMLKSFGLGTVSTKAISGPLGMGNLMPKVIIQHSITYYFWFLAFLSINLGILQLVPIPLLDGWHLVMLAVEKVKGSPVPGKLQGPSFFT